MSSSFLTSTCSLLYFVFVCVLRRSPLSLVVSAVVEQPSSLLPTSSKQSSSLLLSSSSSLPSHYVLLIDLGGTPRILLDYLLPLRVHFPLLGVPQAYQRAGAWLQAWSSECGLQAGNMKTSQPTHKIRRPASQTIWGYNM